MDRNSESRKLMSSGLEKPTGFVQRVGDQTVGAQSLSQSLSISPNIMPNKAITPVSKHIGVVALSSKSIISHILRVIFI